MDGSFESLNSGLLPLSRLVYDMFVKSILQIVSKLDLSVQKVSGEEVRLQLLRVNRSNLLLGTFLSVPSQLWAFSSSDSRGWRPRSALL